MNRILTKIKPERRASQTMKRGFSQPSPRPEPTTLSQAQASGVTVEQAYRQLRSDYSNVGETIIKLADRKIYKQAAAPAEHPRAAVPLDLLTLGSRTSTRTPLCTNPPCKTDCRPTTSSTRICPLSSAARPILTRYSSTRAMCRVSPRDKQASEAIPSMYVRMLC
jgi:hypothetical protein